MSDNLDKRKVSTDALETLGQIIDETEKRDAIHIAVEPTIALEKLFPGQDVGVDGSIKNPVGIVDPFLKSPVFPGQRFWLLVYPREINSLRHVWSHPSFPDEIIDPISVSKKWIEKFAEESDLSYSRIMRGAEDWIDNEDYICTDFLEGKRVPPEFWDHYEIVIEDKVEENKKGNFFTCSC